MASSKTIPSLLDSDGVLATSWEDMAAQVVAFFRNNLGGTTTRLQHSSQQECQDTVMAFISDCLTVEEKHQMNAPLMLNELGDATLAMKKRKCQGQMAPLLNFFKLCGPWWGPSFFRISIMASLGENFRLTLLLV